MMEDDHKQWFLSGLKSLKKDDIDEACRGFEKAYKADRENPLYMSYYGMCAALRWGKIGLGLELCTKAIKKEFFKPEYYLNLGKVYLASDNKKGAITVLLKGLKFDPDNEEIHEFLVQLGARKRAIIPFLKRSNFLNRFLGILFRRTLPNLFGKKGESEASPPE